MTLSSKLLLGLLLGLIVAMFGATISLRRQYDALDKSDKYGRWKKIELPSFRAIKISGASTGPNVEIERAATSRLLVDTLNAGTKKAGYVARVVNDTLLLMLAPDRSDRPTTNYEAKFKPRIRVQCPVLTSLNTTEASAVVDGFTGESLTLGQRGNRSEVNLKRVRFQQLTASLAGRSQLTITKEGNQIETAAITLRDSSRLHQHTDFGKSFTLDAAPGTLLLLTGKAMAQAQQ